MNQKSGVASLKDACRRNILNRTLEKYIEHCHRIAEEQDDLAEGASKKKRAKKVSGKFPNIAGFCRFNRISIRDLETLSREFPEEINMLYAILEDEALNSGLPPAVLSAYLKKRLGYDKELSDPISDEHMTIRFEHNIFDDGE